MCYIYTVDYYPAIRMIKLKTTCNMDKPLKLTVELKEPITESTDCMIPFT